MRLRGAGILAAKLGFAPVNGLEIIESSVVSAPGDALRIQFDMAVSAADLSECTPPAVDAFAANIPGPVHLKLAGYEQLQAARWGIISGFGRFREPELTAAYTRAGFTIVAHQVVQKLERDHAPAQVTFARCPLMVRVWIRGGCARDARLELHARPGPLHAMEMAAWGMVGLAGALLGRLVRAASGAFRSRSGARLPRSPRRR